MHSVPTTTTSVDFAGIVILAAVGALVLLVFMAIALSAWMKRRQMPFAARAVVVILAGIVVFPVLAIVALLGARSSTSHAVGSFSATPSYQTIVPGEEPATVNVPDAVTHQLPEPIHPLSSDHAEAFHGPLNSGHVSTSFVQPSQGISTIKVFFGGILLLVPVLVLIAVVICVHVWMKQRGKSFSVGAVILACVSLLWLLPIVAVLFFVGWKATVATRAIHADFFESNSMAHAKQQVEMARQLSEAARQRGMAAIEAGKKLAEEQTRRVYPNTHLAEPQPPGTQPIPQIPPVVAVKPGDSPPQATVPAEVPPSGPQPIVPSPVPDWVSRGAVQDGDRILAVVSSPQFSQADEARENALVQAGLLVNFKFHARYPQSQGWNVPQSAVNGIAVKQSFVEAIDRTVSTSGTPFRVYRVHLQVETSEPVFNAILPMWSRQVVQQRLAALIAVGVLLTMIFATTSAYLRLNDWTAGAYRGRLRLAAVSLIVAVGLVVTMFA